jgi:glycine betaine/choline ABC-type transport system substrate-binding protein
MGTLVEPTSLPWHKHLAMSFGILIVVVFGAAALAGCGDGGNEETVERRRATTAVEDTMVATTAPVPQTTAAPVTADTVVDTTEAPPETEAPPVTEPEPEPVGTFGAEVAVLQGHERDVLVVESMTDGRVISGSKDATVRVWSANDAENPVVLEGHADWVRAVAEVDDNLVVSGDDQGMVMLWDLDQATAIATWEAHSDWIRALAVTDDGRVLSSADDRTVKVWDLDDVDNPIVFEGHTDWVRALSVLDDGRIVSGDDDSQLLVWAIDDVDNVTSLEGHSGWIMGVEELDDGRLVSADNLGAVWIWDLADLGSAEQLTGGGDVVTDIAVVDDEWVVVSGGETLQAWSLDELDAPLAIGGELGAVSSIAGVAGSFLAAAPPDQTVVVLDLSESDDGTTNPDPDPEALGVFAGEEFRLGTKDFNEPLLLTEILAQALTLEGASVEQFVELQDVDFLREALIDDEIDAYLEYNSTAWSLHLDQDDEVSDGAELTTQVAALDLETNDIRWVSRSPFSSTYGMAVGPALQAEFGDDITYQSMMQYVVDTPDATMCVEDFFVENERGFPLVVAATGLEIPEEQLVLYDSTEEIAPAVASGECSFGEIFTSNGPWSANGLTIVVDDGVFAPFNISLTMPDTRYSEQPDDWELLMFRILAPLDELAMSQLNARVEAGEDFGEVARDYLASIGYE